MCHKSIEPSASGFSHIILKGKKHGDGVKRKNIKCKFSEAFSNTKISDDNQQTLENTLSQSESSKVEIIWLLKCVMSRCSLRFSGDLGDTFIMCHVPWDEESGKNFSMAWSKSAFGVKHGLAPYFKTLLQTTLEKAEILSYNFEESLNEVTQKSEMDLFARF